jgi:hypothetical protein
MSAQAAALASKSVNSTVRSDKDTQFLGRLTGLMFLVTYATSIPPFISLYVPALKDPAFILGGAFDVNVSCGAILELLLILANVATAVALYPVLKKRFPVLSLSFVGARVIESAFIAMGIVAIMALNTLRMQGAVDESSLTLAGQALVAIHDWTFNLGPGVVVGVGNGLILGYMMWKTRLVPRVMSVLGLIGGPALLLAGGAVILGYIEAGSPNQMLLTMPEFFWELSLGIWLLVRGFNRKALAELDTQQA